MNPTAMTIPDDPAELAAWLERQLVGLELATLAAELAVVHRPPADDLRLVEVLGAHTEEVKERGLSGLPRSVLRQLLGRPRLLLDLQELVLTHGGPYWDGVTSPSPDLDEILERGRKRLARVTNHARRPPVVPLRWYRRPWLVSLAAAAAVLLAVFAWDRLRPPASAVSSAWGWDRPEALVEEGPRDVYLNRLADAAEEWFQERPETAAAVARRIAQLRQGCSTLILAEHGPLSEDDRTWLRDRCRKWAAKFDEQLKALEAGGDPTRVRDETDGVVNQLTKAMRDRARAPA